MENLLNDDLNHLFSIAWDILPIQIKDRLSSFIWKVVSANTLDGFQVIFSEDDIKTNSGEALGWCAPNATRTSVCICLSENLPTKDEADAVYRILHEFAHAIEVLEDASSRLGDRSNNRSELAAASQAAAWVARDSEREGYENAFEVMAQAHKDISFSFGDWKHQLFQDKVHKDKS